MKSLDPAFLPEAAYWSLMEEHASLLGAPPGHLPGFSWTGPPAAWGASCHRIDLRLGAEQAMGALAAKMRALDCTALTGPAACGGEAGQALTEGRLAAAGFSFVRQAAGMVLDPRNLGPAPLPPGYAMEEASTPAALEEWAGVVSRNLFHNADAGYAAAFASSAGLMREAGFLDIFLCRDEEGLPVSASSAYADRDGLGGVYFVATEAASRRRGLGAALTRAAAERCAGRGIAIVALHATEEGRPVYESLGFQSVSTLRRYSAPPSA